MVPSPPATVVRSYWISADQSCISRKHFAAGKGPDPAQWLSAPEAFEAVTGGDAGALDMGKLIGQLAPGFKADRRRQPE